MTNIKRKVISGFIILLILAAATYFTVLGTGTGVLAAQATGCAIAEREQKYWITTGVGGENQISCTKDIYYSHTGDPDFGRTDTLFLAIYDQNRLISSKRHIIKLKKFKVNWDEAIHRRIIKGTTYYRLVDEALDKADDNNAVFSRLYECYYEDGSQMKLEIESTVIPYFDDIKAAKGWILDNEAKVLKLRPLTIVDDKIISNWEKQGYKADKEYYDEAPEGLTYESINSGISKHW